MCLTAVFLAGVVYLNALDNPFVYDDHYQIADNPSLTSPTDLKLLLLRNVTRPVLNMSYVIDRAVWGPAPFGYHVTSVLLHMVNVALLFWLAWRWSASSGAAASTGAAFGAALLLAVHPMMTQAVGYISGRSEVLCATFILLALVSADRWFRGGRGVWLVATTVLWVFALGSKEIAIVFPGLLLLCDRWLYPSVADDRRKRFGALIAPLILVAIVAAGLRMAVLSGLEGSSLSFDWRLALVELDVVRRYLWMMIAPGDQTIFHVVSPIHSLLDPRVLLAGVVMLAMIVLGWALHSRMPTVGVGLIWFFLLLIPSSALVTVDRAEPMAEHRVYVASVGLFLAAGAAFDWMLARRRHRGRRVALAAIFLAAIVLLSARTVARNMVWGNPLALWSEASEKAPDHWLPYIPIGEELHAQGRHAEAVRALQVSARLRPETPGLLGKLGVCLVETGELDAAAQTFDRLKAIDPSTAEVPYGQGLVAAASGNPQLARERWLQALVIEPRNVATRMALAALEEPADPAAALRWCEEIRQIAPDTPGNDDCIARNQRRLGGRSGAL